MAIEIKVSFEPGIFKVEEEQQFLLGGHLFLNGLNFPEKWVESVSVCTAMKGFQPEDLEVQKCPNLIYQVNLRLPGFGIWTRTAQFGPDNFFRFTELETCALQKDFPWKRWIEGWDLLHDSVTQISLFCIFLAEELERASQKDTKLKKAYYSFLESCRFLYCQTADKNQRFSLIKNIPICLNKVTVFLHYC
jgi:hypothetical protein